MMESVANCSKNRKYLLSSVVSGWIWAIRGLPDTGFVPALIT